MSEHDNHNGGPPIFLKEMDLARRWGLSVRTIQGHRFRGEGPPHVKLSGGAVRYRLEDVEAYERRQLRGERIQLAPYAGHPKAR